MAYDEKQDHLLQGLVMLTHLPFSFHENSTCILQGRWGVAENSTLKWKLARRREGGGGEQADLLQLLWGPGPLKVRLSVFLRGRGWGWRGALAGEERFRVRLPAGSYFGLVYSPLGSLIGGKERKRDSSSYSKS